MRSGKQPVERIEVEVEEKKMEGMARVKAPGSSSSKTINPPSCRASSTWPKHRTRMSPDSVLQLINVVTNQLGHASEILPD